MDKGKCKSCGADILWITMESGAKNPLDPRPILGGNIRIMQAMQSPYGAADEAGKEYGVALSKAEIATCREPLFMSHFATCPSADAHRKRKQNPIQKPT